MKKLFYAGVTIILVCSCHDNKTEGILQERIDSLTEVVNVMQTELDGYRNSPSKLLAEIQMLYKNGKYANIADKYSTLKKYHPDAQEIKDAERLYKQSVEEIKKAEKKQAAAAAAAEAKRKAAMKPVERIMEKYLCSEQTARAILKKQVHIGMTTEECKASWGRPTRINRTSNAYGTHEQWCYGYSNYLYFEDGILTSIQN